MAKVHSNQLRISENSQVVVCELCPENIRHRYDTTVLEPPISNGARHLYDSQDTPVSFGNQATP